MVDNDVDKHFFFKVKNLFCGSQLNPIKSKKTTEKQIRESENPFIKLERNGITQCLYTRVNPTRREDQKLSLTWRTIFTSMFVQKFCFFA